MAHVTFIHGISNMPPRQVLLDNWLAAVATGGLDLDAAHVTSSMVYWADVVYAAPTEEASAFESVDAGLGTEASDEDLAWIASLPPDERAVAEALIARLQIDAEQPAGEVASAPPPVDEQADFNFEAIPLPWFIKKRVMKRLLKDVHHYLFNARFSPRPGEEFEVQSQLRQRFIDQLQQDQASNDGPHVVVAHSMGTVISYDCLKNVPGCPRIDGYITVGSPLGISEIHDNFAPRHDRRNGYPVNNIDGHWVNLYDRLDPVAFDARIGNDYQHDGQIVIGDERVRNGGRWRHSSYKYYRQPVFVEHLSRMLALG